jgi:hypothetical protein
MVPVGLADEALLRLTDPVEQISDPLGGLVFQVGEQAGEILGGAAALAGCQRGAERIDEGLEPVEQVPHRLGRDLGLGHHLLEPLLISHDHGDLPGGHYLKWPFVWGRRWTIPVETCAIMGVIP